MRAHGEVRGVQQPDRARRGDGADTDHEPGCGRAAALPGNERHRGEGGRPAAGAADHLVRLQHGAGGGADPRRSVPAGVDACDAGGLAGEDLRTVAFRARDQAGDQRFGQEVALIREERGSRCWKPQGRFELSCFGRADEASGVAPLGQAPDAGFEFAGARGGQLDVAGRAIPGVAVEVRGQFGPGPHPGVVEVVIGPGRLVVRVDPGEAPPAGGAAGLVLVEQGHPQAALGQPSCHRGAKDARADHHATTGRQRGHKGIISPGVIEAVGLLRVPAFPPSRQPRLCLRFRGSEHRNRRQTGVSLAVEQRIHDHVQFPVLFAANCHDPWLGAAADHAAS